VFHLLLAGVLGSALVLGSAGAVAALDFEDPLVPPQFLMGAPPAAIAAMPTTRGGARLLTQGAGGRTASLAAPTVSDAAPPEGGSAGAVWTHEGAPGPLHFISGSQWSDGSGCAIWNWNTC
jgi:hypothetical protein